MNCLTRVDIHQNQRNCEETLRWRNHVLLLSSTGNSTTELCIYALQILLLSHVMLSCYINEFCFFMKLQHSFNINLLSYVECNFSKV